MAITIFLWSLHLLERGLLEPNKTETGCSNLELPGILPNKIAPNVYGGPRRWSKRPIRRIRTWSSGVWARVWNKIWNHLPWQPCTIRTVYYTDDRRFRTSDSEECKLFQFAMRLDSKTQRDWLKQHRWAIRDHLEPFEVVSKRMVPEWCAKVASPKSSGKRIVSSARVIQLPKQRVRHC